MLYRIYCWDKSSWKTVDFHAYDDEDAIENYHSRKFKANNYLTKFNPETSKYDMIASPNNWLNNRKESV